MHAPIRKVVLAGESVTLRADLLACIAYADCTDGQELEHAAQLLCPVQTYVLDKKGKPTKELLRDEDGLPIVKAAKNDPRVFGDLLYAFTASWRDSSGWDARNSDRAYDPTIPPRARQRYTELAKLVSKHDYARVRNVIWGLLLEAVLPPGETATANAEDAAVRSTP